MPKADIPHSHHANPNAYAPLQYPCVSDIPLHPFLPVFLGKGCLDQTWDQFNSGIGIDYLKKWIGNEKIGIEKIGIGIEVSYKKIESRNYFIFLQCWHLYVVLLIYWNLNDPELLYIYIYIYIYQIHTPTLAPQVSILQIKMVWILWAEPTTLWHHHMTYL